MGTAKGPRSRGWRRALIVIGVSAFAFLALTFASSACKGSKQAGKDARKTFEKGKEAVKEGLDKTGEAAKEGLEKTKEAAKDFSQGWKEGGKK